MFLTQVIFAQGIEFTIAHWVIIGIVVAAIIGIGAVAVTVFKIQIPWWASAIFWILVVAVVAVAAIQLLLRMVNGGGL